MAITIVPNQPTFGQQFGEALSTGLGKGAANLAVQGAGAGLGALSTGLGRLTGLAPKRGLTKEMLSKAGFKDADIDILLSMPEGDQIKMMELILSRAPEETQPVEVPTNVPQTPEENREESQSISPAFMQDYKDITGRDFMSTMPGAQAEQPKASALFRPTMQQKRQQEATKRAERDLEIKEEKLRFQREQAERSEKREMTKEERIKQHHIDKETLPFYNSVKERVRGAVENNMRLARQKEKIKEGKLVGPGLYKVMKSMGIPLDPDSAEFEKLTNDYLKNAKATFGSRLTDFDVKTFLSTVPSLETSDAAKQAVINNLEIFNEAMILDNEAMKAIIKENGGERPRNLEDLMEERTKEAKDKLAERFKEGLKDIPEETTWERIKRVGTGPLATAVKAGGGALIGGLIGGPAGAGVGATLGSGALGSALSKLTSK